MEHELQPGARRRLFIAAVAVGVAAVISLCVGVFCAARWTGDAAGAGHDLLLVLRGEKNAEEWITEIIIERMAYEAHLPPAEAAALKREMEPISDELPLLSEGEKHKLAMLLRKSVADGRLTTVEIATIRAYSYSAAHDGDARP